ncbi:homogentisate solanesyltransferase [Bertholletia excelsa]
MDPSATDVQVKPEKFEEVKETGPAFHCELSDTEIVRKIAQVLLPGLASACVDNTTGGIFKSPASVAVNMRKEMVDYLTQRSENFVAESVISEGGQEQHVSDNPYDIISDFVDDFASTKRNFFSRVSGWILSDRREDRIDDFVQEMEINGFWFMERREAIAQTLLKNVDFKNAFHCDSKFNTARELAVHWPQCNFRTMDCINEGCNARFCAAQQENHDSVCPFKMLLCEQKCSDSIMRREMDKHCLTVCPMKLVNCPFFPVGCQSSIPQCTTVQHRLESLHSHLLYILQSIHKDASEEDLKPWVEKLIELSSPEQLAEPRDVRSLTLAVRNLEAKLEPLKITIKPKVSVELDESSNKSKESKNEGGAESPSPKNDLKESPGKKEEQDESPKSTKQSKESPTKKEEHPPPEKVEQPESPVSSEESGESPNKTKELTQLLPEGQIDESPTKEENTTPLPENIEKIQSPTSPAGESSESSPKTKESTELFPEEEVSQELSTEEKYTKSLHGKEEQPESPASSEEGGSSHSKKEQFKESPARKEEQIESPTSEKGHDESSHEKEESVKSASDSEESCISPPKIEKETVEPTEDE